jgi:hypothetical protein
LYIGTAPNPPLTLGGGGTTLYTGSTITLEPGQTINAASTSTVIAQSGMPTVLTVH